MGNCLKTCTDNFENNENKIDEKIDEKCKKYTKLEGILRESKKEPDKIMYHNEIIPAKIIRIIDGDTAVVSIVYAEEKTTILRVRFVGIDTPEISRAKSDLEKKVGQGVKKYVEDIIQENITPIRILEWGAYGGRVIGEIYTDISGKHNVSEILLKKGLALPYDGKKKKRDWTIEELINAEKVLRDNDIMIN
jgi:endonuclease YncB( thermonuclease family)